MAIGIWAAPRRGVALGPVVGGVLLDHLVGLGLLVNVPIVVIAIVAAPRSCRVARPVARRIDWIGAVLSVRRPRRARVGDHRGAGQGLDGRRRLAAFAVAGVAGGFVVVGDADRPSRCSTCGSSERAVHRGEHDVMLLFFALFGFLFLSTQYLQFVLGYSPSAAGVRMLPYAGAMIVVAPLSAKLVARFGTRRVVTAGCAVRDRSCDRATITRQRLRPPRRSLWSSWVSAWASRALRDGVDHGLAATGPSQVGSAVNDTTRELGGALGVAVVGSILSSLYGSRLDAALPADVPAPVVGGSPGVGGRSLSR